MGHPVRGQGWERLTRVEDAVRRLGRALASHEARLDRLETRSQSLSPPRTHPSAPTPLPHPPEADSGAHEACERVLCLHCMPAGSTVPVEVARECLDTATLAATAALTLLREAMGANPQRAAEWAIGLDPVRRGDFDTLLLLSQTPLVSFLCNGERADRAFAELVENLGK